MNKVKIVINAIKNRKSGRLSKMFLMAAPPGSYLVSNLISTVGWKPIFAEVVASSNSDKLAQWQRIVGVGANQRFCCLYKF